MLLASRTGARIETWCVFTQAQFGPARLPHGGADRNSPSMPSWPPYRLASRTGARIETPPPACRCQANPLASRTGARIETRPGASTRRSRPARLPHGGAARNRRSLVPFFALSSSPPARGRGSKLTAGDANGTVQARPRTGARIAALRRPAGCADRPSQPCTRWPGSKRRQHHRAFAGPESRLCSG